jgi:hypothetical protein
MSAPTLKMKYAVNVAATTFRITDLTGAYSGTNLGGWGAPNWKLNETALFVVVKRNASAGDEYFTAVTTDVTTNPSAVSTDVTEIDMNYANDGVLDITLGALRVSTDGINYINAGGGIATGEYFYWSNNGQNIWFMNGVTPEAVADIHTLVGEGIVPQVNATDIIEARLAIMKQTMYKKYRLLRDTDCDDAEPQFQELLKLSQDIQGSIYAFYSGLATEAQSQIETMLDRYLLTNQML